MSEQEQMDDLIRSKFSEERDFTFDEENWAKAEEMIIAQRKKEKRKRWGIIFFSGISIGVLVMIPFIIQKDGNTILIVKEEKKQIVENTNTVSTISNSNEKNSSKQTTTENESQNTTTTGEEKSNSSNVAEEKREEKRAAVVAETKVAEQKVIRKPVFSSTSNNKEKIQVKVADENEKSGTVKEPVITKEKKKKAESPIASGASWYFYNKTAKEQGMKDFNKREGINRKNEDNWRRSSKAQSNSTAIAPNAKENQKNSDTTKNTSAKTNEIKENSSVTATTTANVNTNENNVVQQNTTEPVSKDSSKTEPVIMKKDTTPIVVTPPVQKDSISKPKSTWTVSLDLGVNTFLSGGSGVSPFGGINITKSFTPKWEIGTGIYYTYLPTYSSSSTFTTSTVYDFGYNFKLTEIVTDKLHYMTAPLFLKYNLNEKNSIVLGANFYYLFNSSNIITTYDLSYSGIQNKVSKKTSGYYNGFSDYDVGIMAGYRKNLFEKFGLAIYINYGLINIQKAGTVNSINMHNNISGQLMLTYKLFK
ncbi:MAG TPA: outer membrane beta-barrel protein [Bacteroidia bacterium]|jgi:hypothetical protein|nr:outer membrane beta-barrel protein [Bacteroidia bacterium]